MAETSPPPARRGARIAMVLVPAMLTVGLAVAWFMILARTGGDLGIELGSRAGTPAWFSLTVVGILGSGMAVFTVAGIVTMRRPARTPAPEDVLDPDDDDPSTPA